MYKELGWIQQTLLDQFHHRASEIALRDCASLPHQIYTYQDVEHKISIISEYLLPHYSQRALLLLPGSSYFVFSFLACAMSGVTAVPVNLPGEKRIRRVKTMLTHIMKDCDPKIILAMSSSRESIESLGWNQERQVIYLDELFETHQGFSLTQTMFRAPVAPVMLQYSSGSTGVPKAVCNYDKNIMNHHHLMVRMNAAVDGIHTATWLPFYHDLGLFYGLLFPLFSGGSCTFIRPSQFVADPLSWLSLIGQYKATIITAPDFAYRLCVDAVDEKEVPGLDLSSLQVALTAAEPIRPETVDLFQDYFRPAGFTPDMYMTGYGMAEATLVVSYKKIGAPMIRKTFDEKALAQGIAKETPQGRELIGCGKEFGSWDLRIVDPDTCLQCEAGQVGEVWMSGECLPAGYWNQPELTASVYQAKLAGQPSDKHYLRTGDLAFLLEGELYICGRIKDVIIVAGENHMPNDMEATIEKYCELVDIGGACFVQDTETGDINSICEVHRHTPEEYLESLAQDIYARVRQHHHLLVSQVILIPKGHLKKTSSGKIRRRHMLMDLNNETLNVLYRASFNDINKEEIALRTADGKSAEPDFILSSLKAVLGEEIIDEKQGFADLGVTSLVAAQWCRQLAGHYGLSMSPTILFAYPNVKALRQWIHSRLPSQATEQSSVSARNQQVAVVAISCRLPRQEADSSWRDYADWLMKGECAGKMLASDDRQFSLPVGYLEDVDKFDARFFGLSSQEARLMDPQQRWLMELGWHLFEQAGWSPAQIKGQKYGIYIGQGSQDYSDMVVSQNHEKFAKGYFVTGNSRSAASGRLAKYFGLRGPAVTIDTACSSSLVAIDAAVKFIQSGSGNTAIAGGVNFLLSASNEQALISAGMLSPDGCCSTLSEQANGYMRSEGAGLILLKSYDAAVADGDPILAVIEASAVGQDGESSSLTAPNPLAQGAMVQDVLEQSGLSVDDIDAVEMNGTGTALGDSIELHALDSVYSHRQKALNLTTFKPQLGHFESASGVVGVIHAVAQMHQQHLFAHPGFTRFNPHLSEWMSRYAFSRHVRPEKLSRMAVNAFGFTGTLAHLILRHYPQDSDWPEAGQSQTDLSETDLSETDLSDTDQQSAAGSSQPPLRQPTVNRFPLTAASEHSLRALAARWKSLLQHQPDTMHQPLIQAWLCKREHGLPVRVCLKYADVADLTAQLDEIACGILPDSQTAGSEVELWLQGEHYDWSASVSYPIFPATVINLLPLYPFCRERYWIELPEAAGAVDSLGAVAEAAVDGHAFITRWLKEALDIETDTLSDQDNLINLGLNSVQLIDFVDEARKAGVHYELVRLYEHPTIQGWLSLWHQETPVSTSQVCAENCPDDVLSQPFELTNIQRAYWQGRNPDLVLGGVACHAYLEFNCPTLDTDRLSDALNALVQRHSLLRMRMNADGAGYFIAYEPARITVYPWQDLSDSEAQQKQLELREQLQSRVPDLRTEPGFAVCVSQTAQGSRLHVDVDMVIADAMSIEILLDDLAGFYTHPETTQAVEPTVHFPEYLHDIRTTGGSDVDQAYWEAQIPDLPGAPALPLAVRPEQTGKPRFVHRQWQLPATRWTALQQAGYQHQITPSMLLAACFAETLRGWSDHREFCLNLTIFNRRHETLDIADMVADFTTLMLLACRPSAQDTLLDNARCLNETFMAGLDHARFDAVNVLREMSRQSGTQVMMPVVFTSNIGHDFLPDYPFGKIDYVVSQTPQVWLDCQVRQDDGNLVISWDSVDELFPEQMIDHMFDFMGRLITSLAEQPERLSEPVHAFLSDEQLEQRFVNNQTNLIPLHHRTLHGRFFEWAESHPGHIALIDERGSLTYQELAERATGLAYRLYQHDVCVGDRVAVILPKGREQIIATLAVHVVGAAYIPLDKEQPQQRIQQIIAQASPRCLVADSSAESYSLPVIDIADTGAARLEQPCWPRFWPGNVAYIIYTSGSTGVPKGVVTTHQAAANTIDDMIVRLSLNPSSRSFALSALNFDLSVFDIFAPLAVGGAVVVPAEADRKEARCWLEMINQHQVTVWNSVPALFEMLLIAAESSEVWHLPETLEHVLLSGDWVGLDLYPRLHQQNPQTKLLALGGATEAAIWSNAFPVSQVDPQWRSIPYGYALSHQSYRVMDEQCRDCPDWVIGELWIGGEGVAQGYFGDPEKTAAQFVVHEGQRYYRTGDTGRFWPDGVVEFSGRRDNQVKVHGHRIELGEIEHVASAVPGIQKALALVTDAPSKQILLFVETDDPAIQAQLTEDYMPVPEHGFSSQEKALVAPVLRAQLPDYMLPQHIVLCRKIPLTANGKLDRKQLTVIAQSIVSDSQQHEFVAPSSPEEMLLTQALTQVLSWPKPLSVTDNFFSIGGDSLTAMQLTSVLEKQHGVILSLRTIFNHQTIARIAQSIEIPQSTDAGVEYEEGAL
ncbi:Phenyloxazoline synthase MbtB [Vibrio aerogenes CECT 7868]|uniref:Phenyloxazoline synthase MbtB n=1 Tax=Vibrio aerogenes CECT 7868 TaxID=1216006 RepID=A0A1M5UN08_9VIBR|nr:non-ribosomal peptide synthetase [Vibrio aerogenes]SHH64103.1 Phenyloxazoline synthase MbtB [Vibrio aerogenes CECT 7868]